jgi:son of sevenless-like protein
MVQDDDVLERDDAYILDHMMEFVAHDEVITLPAAKQLMVIIKRAVRAGLASRLHHLNYGIAAGA